VCLAKIECIDVIVGVVQTVGYLTDSVVWFNSDDQLIYICSWNVVCLPLYVSECFICLNFYCICFNIMGILASTCFRIDLWFGIASVCCLVCQLLR
jgi:hypothetical protein